MRTGAKGFYKIEPIVADRFAVTLATGIAAAWNTRVVPDAGEDL